MAVATRDAEGFSGCGIDVIDPGQAGERASFGGDRARSQPALLLSYDHRNPGLSREAGQSAFRPLDWQAVMTAERFYHDPDAVG